MRSGLGGALGLALAVACGGQERSGGNPNSDNTRGSPNVTLTIAVSGQGSVTAPAQSIACAATCAQRLAAGTVVQLVATPAAGMQFTGWSGACTGTGSCLIVLGSDASVAAQFASVVVADPCDGLRPALPAAKTFINPAGGAAGDVCGTAMTDGLGNLYIDNRESVRGVIFSLPLASGFATLGPGMTPNRSFAGYAADGTPLFYTTVSLLGPYGERANGGFIFTTITWGDARTQTVDFEFRRFDDKGAETRVHVANQPWPAEEMAIVVDTQDRTLIVFGAVGSNFGVPPSHLAARWFDVSGQPLTTWFDAGMGSGISLRPLIGGGAALRTKNGWVATLASGKAGVGPAPAGFEAEKDPRIVLGGKAYAMMPHYPGGSIDIVEPGGKSCGTLTTTTAADRFFIGRDGTLINLTGPFPHPGGPNNQCTATYYPQVLK
jgi:Divergent InlB B-repeat domain